MDCAQLHPIYLFHTSARFLFQRACKQNPQPPFSDSHSVAIIFFLSSSVPLFSVTVRHSAQGENESKTPVSLALRFITPQQKNT